MEQYTDPIKDPEHGTQQSDKMEEDQEKGPVLMIKKNPSMLSLYGCPIAIWFHEWAI